MKLIVQDNTNKVRFAVNADNKSQAVSQAKQRFGVTDDLKVYKSTPNGNLKRMY